MDCGKGIASESFVGIHEHQKYTTTNMIFCILTIIINKYIIKNNKKIEKYNKKYYFVKYK